MGAVKGSRGAARHAAPTGRRDVYSIVCGLFLTVWALLIVYPFYNSFLISVAPYRQWAESSLLLYPEGISFESYEIIAQSENLLFSVRTSVLVVVFGILYSMVLSTTTAFALSRRRFYGRRFVHNLIIFTMYFHGGLIPYYLLVNRLGLRNTLGALILPFGINTFYMFIMKVYFQNIPESLVESAKIDGANEFQILFRIIMPVSLPIVATFVLFYGVDRWNDWFTGVLFSSKPSVVPLQTFLRQVIGNLEALSGGTMAFQSPAYARAMLIQEKIKQACAMAASIPILFFYPALQRYFMKGILVGAIKA